MNYILAFQISIITCVAPILLHAQNLFYHTYGHLNTSVSDYANDMAIDLDKNIYIIGTNTSFGDFIISKFDSTGSHLWSKKIGANGGQPYRILALHDSCLLICGGVNSVSSPFQDLTLIKIDTSCNIIWNISIEQNEPISPSRVSIEETENDNILAAYTNIISNPNGTSNYVTRIFRTTSYGNIIWFKSLETTSDILLGSLSAPDSNTIILTGSIDSSGSGNYDMLVLKFDASGGNVNSTSFGNTPNEYGYAFLTEANGTNVIIGTEDNNPLNYRAPILIAVDDSLNIIWNYKFAFQNDFKISSVTTMENGNFIVAGNGPLFMQMDTSGSIIWANSYGNSGFNLKGVKAINTNDNQLNLCGNIFSNTDIFFSKTDSLGYTTCNFQSLIIPARVATTLLKTYTQILLVDTLPIYSSTIFAVFNTVIIDSLWCSGYTIISDQEVSDYHASFPNPASDFILFNIPEYHDITKYQIIFYNSKGQVIDLPFYQIKNDQYKINLDGISNGMYFYIVIHDSKNVYSNKFVVSK